MQHIPPNLAKGPLSTFGHKVDQKCGFCMRIERGKVQKVHFLGPKGSLLGWISILATGWYYVTYPHWSRRTGHGWNDIIPGQGYANKNSKMFLKIFITFLLNICSCILLISSVHS